MSTPDRQAFELYTTRQLRATGIQLKKYEERYARFFFKCRHAAN
jgi:hypothetical protein